MSREISRALGRPINHKRIGRLMRQDDLQSRKRRRFRVVTTDSKHAHPIAPNVLERDFEATAPNQKWLADMTYVPTGEGWLYLALVLDLFARKIVGWAMSETMPQELTLEALHVALGWRDPPDGLVHHSDRGSQYAAQDYRKALAARGITVSMSRKGDCWDNAPMESVNGTVKVECVHEADFKTRDEAAQAIVEYIGYYNTERMHSSLGYLTPSEFERRWRADNERPETIVHEVAPRCPPPAGSRFVASDRTGRPWTTLIGDRGVHQTGTGSPNREPPSIRKEALRWTSTRA